ncbi:MAG: hypothetical protein AVDCRST_MAG76-998 [uncultured Acidimicrobiales bacterium]|uniref:Centromere protein J C-terminal domain-containing protein n=1 Tax=uncultured Acidimicrobiales bacterium TaxID=310071 RepID=A0A6J4HJM4_9ACTN|nr:MAG: hypothetical protein AVDCRST_MAG76-998 [uncultured Acidimicrobiales bacterium]
MSGYEREPRVIEEQSTREPGPLPDPFDHLDPVHPDPRDHRDDPPARPRDGLDAERQDPNDHRDDLPPRPIPRPTPKPPDQPAVVHHPDGTVETRSADGSVDLQFRNGSSELREPNGAITRTDLRRGTTEHIRPDGSRDIEYPDGRVVDYRTDGTVMTVYANGEFDQTRPDGSVEHWRQRVSGQDPVLAAVERPEGSWESHRPDGTVITTYPDRSIVIRDPDGAITRTSLDDYTETTDADGTVTRRYPNGDTEMSQPNGTVGRHDERAGTFTLEYPDGTAQITHGDGDRVVRIGPEGTVTTHPNGTSRSTYRDGRIERTNEEGRVIQVENPDGTWEFHRLDGRVQHNWTDGTIVFDRPDGVQQIFWPDNSEELRAGGEPLRPPKQDVPILHGSTDDPASGSMDEPVRAAAGPADDLFAPPVVAEAAASQNSMESVGKEADDDVIGLTEAFAADTGAGELRLQRDAVEPGRVSEPIPAVGTAGAADQAPSNASFDGGAAPGRAVEVTEQPVESTVESNDVDWSAGASSETAEPAPDNQASDWTE